MNLARVVELMSRGLSKTEALDYVLVSEVGVPAEDWAEIRDVESPGAVKKQVETAEEKLNSQATVQSRLDESQAHVVPRDAVTRAEE